MHTATSAKGAPGWRTTNAAAARCRCGWATTVVVIGLAPPTLTGAAALGAIPTALAALAIARYGDERARALGHLSGCPACRRELAASAEVVDELLLLAPEHETPAGFESSVLARLMPAAPPRRRRRPRLLWAASIVAIAGLAAGAVWWQTADDASSPATTGTPSRSPTDTV
jgi:hypothetical protein